MPVIARTIAAAWCLAALASCKMGSSDGPTSPSDTTEPPAPPLPDPVDDAGCDAGPNGPRLEAIPTRAGVGAWLTLAVRNVDPSQSFQILFDGTPGKIVGQDADGNYLVIVPPDARSGFLTLVVGCARYTNPNEFTVDPTPAARIDTQIPPMIATGTILTLNGAYFTGAGTVSIAGLDVRFAVVDDSTLDVYVGADAGAKGRIGISTVSGISYTDSEVTVGP